MLTRDESGLVIGCIAKGLDQLLEGMHSFSSLMIPRISAIAITSSVSGEAYAKDTHSDISYCSHSISQIDTIVEVDHQTSSRISSLNPHHRLEEQMPEVFIWQHYDSRGLINTKPDPSRSPIHSLITIASLLESFVLGRISR